jgi:hypothetical protein
MATAHDWRTWLDHGNKYIKPCVPNKSKVKFFRPNIRYNLLSMAFESYVMGILDYYKFLPENHTYTDLIFALENVTPLDSGLKGRILKYENIQSICSVDKFIITEPSEDDLSDLYSAVKEISIMAHKICA